MVQKLRVIVFEDQFTHNFRPITYTKPTFDIILGTETLFQTIFNQYGKSIDSLIVQPYLIKTTKQRHPGIMVNQFGKNEDTLFLNGLVRLEIPEIKKILQIKTDFVAYCGDQVAVCKANA